MAIVGIDLGTTNSLIGVIEKGRPRLFTDTNGSTLVPSVVTFGPTGTKVGADAVSVSVEEVTAGDWTDKVYKPDILASTGTLYKKPGYNPLK